MDPSLGQIVIHPEFLKKQQQEEEEARAAAARREAQRDVLLHAERSFAVAEGLTFTIAQSWASAPEPDCTGHAVWSAAELLANFIADDTCWHALNSHSDAEQPNAQTAVELGCGVGCLPGLTCLLRRDLPLIFTDGSPGVLQRAEKNVERNLKANSSAEGYEHLPARTFVPVWWGSDEGLPAEMTSQADVPWLVLMSDVAYDKAVHNELGQCLELCLQNPQSIAISCNAPRSDTKDLWRQHVEECGLFDVQDLYELARECLGDELVGKHDVLLIKLRSNSTHI